MIIPKFGYIDKMEISQQSGGTISVEEHGVELERRRGGRDLEAEGQSVLVIILKNRRFDFPFVYFMQIGPKSIVSETRAKGRWKERAELMEGAKRGAGYLNALSVSESRAFPRST